MFFFERLFGISPDAGNGSFELILLMIPLAILAIRRAKKGASHG